MSPLIHNLKVLIYSHAVDKFHRRIDKRWEGFQALLKALKTIILSNAEVPQAEPNMNHLNLVQVSKFLKFLPEKDVERGEDFLSMLWMGLMQQQLSYRMCSLMSGQRWCIGIIRVVSVVFSFEFYVNLTFGR